MKKFLVPVLLSLAVGTAGFLAGARFASRSSRDSSMASGRKVLYYVDPMNPSHTSGSPGLAPCGMKMEPVYADEAGANGGKTPPAGTINVGLDKQQLVGVRTGKVERKPLQQTLRLLGKVTPDETRIFRITAAADGSISKVMPQVAGSYVRRDEVLATFYTPGFASAAQTMLLALGYQAQVQTNFADELALRKQITQNNVRQYRDSLKNLGVGNRQIEQMINTRVLPEEVDIVAPAEGFIVARNTSEGQRFERGAELYRIVDLGRVWVLVDLFNRDAPLVPPGIKARVLLPAQNVSREAKLSEALPQFDSVTRTLKLRFEADNPEYLLKPDMFVDVEVTVAMPEALVVPADAVVDTGSRKLVFVDRGNGHTEPRTVQTGWRIGDYLEVREGLMSGEEIVTSGTFMLDSESRMKLAAAGVHGTPEIDPVCGMNVDRAKARADGLCAEHGGDTYFFCNTGCKKEFAEHPATFLTPRTSVAGLSAQESGDHHSAAVSHSETPGGMRHAPATVPASSSHGQTPTQEPAAPQSTPHGAQAPSGPSFISVAVDPVCGMKVNPATSRMANRLKEFQGITYYFCNDGCKQEFQENPTQFIIPPTDQPDLPR